MISPRALVITVTASAIALAVTGCTPSTPSGLDAGPMASPTAVATDLDAGTLAYLEANAEALAGQLGIENPPDVQPIRLISLQEYASTQVPCLQAAGFAVGYTADGEGVSYPQLSDPALQQSFNLAVYTCELQYPVQQRYVVPLSTDGLKALYAYRTGELVGCLESEGYNVSADPPSETVFVQSGGMWSPYQGLAIDSSDTKQIYADCPQTPDDIYGT